MNSQLFMPGAGNRNPLEWAKSQQFSGPDQRVSTAQCLLDRQPKGQMVDVPGAGLRFCQIMSFAHTYGLCIKIHYFWKPFALFLSIIILLALQFDLLLYCSVQDSMIKVVSIFIAKLTYKGFITEL